MSIDIIGDEILSDKDEYSDLPHSLMKGWTWNEEHEAEIDRQEKIKEAEKLLTADLDDGNKVKARLRRKLKNRN